MINITRQASCFKTLIVATAVVCVWLCVCLSVCLHYNFCLYCIYCDGVWGLHGVIYLTMVIDS